MAHETETYIQLVNNKCRCKLPVEAVKEVTHQGAEIVSQRIIASSCKSCGTKFVAPDWMNSIGMAVIHLTKQFKKVCPTN